MMNEPISKIYIDEYNNYLKDVIFIYQNNNNNKNKEYIFIINKKSNSLFKKQNYRNIV